MKGQTLEIAMNCTEILFTFKYIGRDWIKKNMYKSSFQAEFHSKQNVNTR